MEEKTEQGSQSGVHWKGKLKSGKKKSVSSTDRETTRLLGGYGSDLEALCTLQISKCQESNGVSRASAVTGLATFILDHDVSHLSHRNLPEQIVDPFILDYLKNALLESEEFRTSILLWKAVKVILEDETQATHLLSPIVLEVDVDGRERQAPNPIRLSLIHNLEVHAQFYQKRCQAALDSTRNSFNPLHLQDLRAAAEAVASCILSLLQEAHRLEGTKRHALGSKFDIAPMNVFDFFQHSIACEVIPMRLALEIVSALIRRHPESAAQLTTHLLLPHYNQSSSGRLQSDCCAACGLGPEIDNIPLLQILHSEIVKNRRNQSGQCGGVATKLVEAAATACQLLVENAPLHQWVPADASSDKKRRPSKSPCHQHAEFSYRGGFRDSIVQSLEICCRICQCPLLLQKQHPSPVQPSYIASFAGSMFRFFPFENNGSLENRGVETVKTWTKAFCRPQLGSEVRLACALVLAAAIGGEEMPDGNYQPMCGPMKSFLDSSEGSDFMVSLLRKSKQADPTMQKILYSIAQTYPQTFWKDDASWNSFAERVCSQGENLRLLESFLRGRNSNQVLHNKPRVLKSLVQVILPVLLECLGGSTVAKSSALSGLGFLLPMDWERLVEESKAHLCWEELLGVCSDPMISQSLRKTAFKAMGDVCSNYFAIYQIRKTHDISSELAETPTWVCTTVICRILSVWKTSPESCPYLSMTIYAAGNLLRALAFSSLSSLLDSEQANQIAAYLLQFGSGPVDGSREDPKIVSNSIRALGHLLCVLYQVDEDHRRFEKSLNCGSVLGKSLRLFQNRIRRTVQLANRELEGLSWKDRSSTKKLGWGAANALAMIGEATTKSDSIADEVLFTQPVAVELSSTLALLLEIIALHIPVLPDKVTAACVKALGSLDVARVRRCCWSGRFLSAEVQFGASFHSDKATSWGDLWGKAVVVSVRSINEKSLPSSGTSRVESGMPQSSLRRSQEESIELALLHLLKSCTVATAESLFYVLETEELHFLHSWMVSKSCPRYVFDSFVLALQMQTLVTLDVDLENKFSQTAVSLVSALEPTEHDDESEL